MGTNYYLKCECCKQKRHIGKFSYLKTGGRFTFRIYRSDVDDISTDLIKIEDWKDFTAGKQIENKYREYVSWSHFWDIIKGCNDTAFISGEFC